MKSQKSKFTKPIVLFLSTPSCTMLKEYKMKSDMLNKAIIESKMVNVMTYGNRIIKLKNLGNDAGKYFGVLKIKGKMRKLFLNINDIKKITLL